MRLAITGTRGTLGQSLVRQATAAGHTILHLNRPDYSITNYETILRAILDFGPHTVIHPAAYTNVDGAESNPAEAYAINALGTRNLALASVASGAQLVYVSTNMVFWSDDPRPPFNEWDTRTPRGAYATSKYAGEHYIEHLMQRFYIARVSWLYGKQGDSFVHKIVRAADARGSLGVVADEIATPTYAEDLSAALLTLLTTNLYGWYHLVNEGECSRYEYAQQIMRLTNRTNIPISPSKLADFKRPAPTAPYSTIKNNVGAH
ncbi:MAG: dTDP-4-dehydrorhamnose reductase, partial [Chloroflexia bacterium]